MGLTLRTIAALAPDGPEPAWMSYSPGRIVQISDLAAMLPPVEDEIARPDPSAIEEFAHYFVQPPLGRDDDVRRLGNHRLVVIGSPQQAAWVERAIAVAAQSRGDQVFVDVKLLAIPAADFAAHCLPLSAGQPARESAVPGDLQAILGFLSARGRRERLLEQLGLNLPSAPRDPRPRPPTPDP